MLLGDCDVPEVELFATHKVFLDADFDKTGKEVRLTIIAPTWEVILQDHDTERKIILDGKAATEKEPKETSETVGPGSDGRDGKSGEPGGPAGDFIGIGQEIIGGKQLIVSVKGGKGGPGQDGGDGIQGREGAPPLGINPPESARKMWRDAGNTYDCEVYGKGEGSSNLKCDVYGKYGGPGGKGGDGGKGGLGGKEGYVNTVFLDYGSTDIKVYNSSGEEGDPGNPGAGGARGNRKHLRVAPILCCHKDDGDQYDQVIDDGGKQQVVSKYAPREDTRPGSNGNKGNLIKDTGDRKSPKRNGEYPKPSLKINAYKSFLRENLSHSLAKSQRFLEKLETRSEISNLYETIGLVSDMQSLEAQYPKLNTLDKKLFLPYYENLLKRIEEYSPKEKDYEHQVVQGFLRSSIMTKIREISFTSNNGFVIKPKEHLANVMEHIIKPMIELKESLRNNEARKGFLEPIENRIREAENIVENVIGPEIENIIKQTNKEINKLIEDTLEMQNKAHQKAEELIKKKQQLGFQLALRGILGIVQIASQFMALAGPVGAAAGAAIGGVTSIAQGALPTSSGSPDFTQVPAGVTKSLASITSRLKENQEVLKQQLTDTEVELNRLQSKDDDIEELKAKIKTSQKTLEADMAAGNIDDPETVDRMYNMRKDLNELLTKKKKILQTEQTELNQKTDRRLQCITKVQNMVNLGSTGLDFYKAMKNNMKAIDDTEEAIQKAKEEKARLEEYERTIYRTMLPMVKGISNHFKNLQSESAGKSHAALDVTKWQVQSNFMDIKKKLKEMTEGFKSQGELNFLMDKMEMGMTTTVQVYDRIKDYKDKVDLANFIAELSAHGGNRIEDVALFDHLQLNIFFNSLLTEYEKSLKAVRLSAFPFINRYINTEDDECEFNFEADGKTIHESTVIGHKVKCIADKFSSILKELENDDNVLTSTSQNIYQSNDFNSGNYHMPFFTTAFDGNNDFTLKLLKGQQVELNADVMCIKLIRAGNHAVKFNQIGIRLQVPNSKADDDLKKALDGFIVQMTHSGDSTYRCGDNFYAINHEKVVITHSVNNYTEFENKDSFAIRTSAAILSPYTLWKIRLLPKTGASFDKLEKFAARPMKLHLEGKGWYISQESIGDSSVCNKDLVKYYNKIGILEGSGDPEIGGNSKGMTMEKVDVRRRRRSVDDEQDELVGNGTVTEPEAKSTRISTAALQSLSGGGQGRRRRSVSEDQQEEIVGEKTFPNAQISISTSMGSGAHKSLTGDDTPMGSSQISYNAADMSSNLLLMNLLVRKPNWEKRQKRSSKLSAERELAHNIAYRAHVPMN